MKNSLWFWIFLFLIIGALLSNNRDHFGRGNVSDRTDLETQEKEVWRLFDFSNSSDHLCRANMFDCADFETQEEAQGLFDRCGGTQNDVHHLDRDEDGYACETLP